MKSEEAEILNDGLKKLQQRIWALDNSIYLLNKKVAKLENHIGIE